MTGLIVMAGHQGLVNSGDWTNSDGRSSRTGEQW